MKLLDLIGRILFAVPMMMSGFIHFSKSAVITRMVPSFVPGKEIWVYATGLGFILAGISIIIGKKSKIGALLLGVMIVAFAVLVHMGGFLKGNPLASSMFIRDIALGGGAIFIAAHSKD